MSYPLKKQCISVLCLSTGQVGGRVFLSCAIYNLHNKSVSWIRERDGYILTVDRETFISDSRYSEINEKKLVGGGVLLLCITVNSASLSIVPNVRRAQEYLVHN